MASKARAEWEKLKEGRYGGEQQATSPARSAWAQLKASRMQVNNTTEPISTGARAARRSVFPGLLRMDTAAGRQELEDLEQKQKVYDEAFRMWASSYEANPQAWDPEEFGENIEKYNNLKASHGSAQALDALVDKKRKQVTGAENAQAIVRRADAEAGWQQKYAGHSYRQLQDLMAQMDPASEEYNWLSRYAPTTMKAGDYQQALEESRALLAAAQEARTQHTNSEYDWTDNKSREQYIARLDELDAQLREAEDRVWQDERKAKYASLPEMEDYAEKSTPAFTEATSNIGKRNGDPVYDAVNGLDNGVLRPAGRGAVAKGSPAKYEIYKLMTEEEVANYNYLYNTEGRSAAEEYLEYVTYALNERNVEKTQREMALHAKDMPVAASLESVPQNLLGGMGYMDVAMQKLINTVSGDSKPIDYNRSAMLPSVAASTIRSTVAQDITDATGTIQIDPEEHPVMSRIFNGKSLGDVYQLGMSMLDSAAVAALAPAIGSGGTVLLGGSAATQGMLDAVEKGATDEQALGMGLLNGAAEIVFEKYSLESLLNGPTDSLIKTMLKQGVAEGSEEFFTSAANNLADALIMAEKSGYMQNVQQYRDAGYSEAKAVSMALSDMAIDMGWDFVGGVFTGGIMGGGSYAVDKVQQNFAGGAVQAPAIENTAQEMDGVKYSIRNTSQMTLKEQLNQYYNKKLKSSDAFYLGETPASLEKAGLSSAPLALTTSSFRKSVTEKHNIPRRVLNKLNESLQNPILSFESDGKVGVLIDDIDADGKAVLVGIHGNQTMDRETVNEVKSIYGLDNPEAWIRNQIDSGKRIHVYNEEKANAFLQTYGYKASVEDGIRSVARVAEPAQIVNNENNSEYIPSAQGQVIREGSDLPVQVAGVASAGDGKLVIELADGTTADVAELSFPDHGEQLLYEKVAELADNAETARQLLRGYREGNVSAQVYARGMDEGYHYGKLQFSPDEMLSRGSFIGMLDPVQQNTAYSLGKMAGDKEAARKREAIQAGRSSQNSKKGQVHFEGDRNGLTERQRTSLTAVEVVAKTLGVQIHVYQSQQDSRGRRVGENGRYDPKDGSIHIDLHAGNNGEGVMMFTLAHELTHFVRDWSPEKYRTLAGFLAEQYGKDGHSVRDMVLLQQKKAESDDRKLTFEQAHEEWVADSMEMMLTDGTVIEKLAMLQAKDKGLVQKIREFMDKFVQKLKSVYEGIDPQTREGQIVSSMVDAANRLQEIFTDALIDAGENYQGAKNTAQEGGSRFSVRDKKLTEESTEEERYRLLKDATISLATVKPQLIENVDLETYNTRRKSAVVPGLKTIARQLGILNVDLENSEITFPFKFSGKNLEISLHHQLEYGGTYQDYVKAMSCFNELVENALPIEVHTEKKIGTAKENKNLVRTYVLVSAFNDGKSVVPVQFEVKEFRERNNSLYMTVVLTKIDLEVVDTGVPDNAGNVPHLFSRSTISLRHIFENVNQNDGRFLKYVPDGFLNVAQKQAKQEAIKKQEAEYSSYEKRGGPVNANVRKSTRDQDGVSARQLLANTFESMTTSDAEYKSLQAYKAKIEEMAAQEQKLQEINAQIKELFFASGPRDMEKLNALRMEQQKTVNRINNYDSQLLRLENAGPLRSIVERQKKAAYQQGYEKAQKYYRERSERREQEIRQYYRESRQRAVERHDKAQMKQKVLNVVKELNSLLVTGGKERHVPEQLQLAVTGALEAINMETVDRQARMEKINAAIENATDPEIREELEERKKQLENADRRFMEHTRRLQDAYRTLKESTDPMEANGYDDVIMSRVEAVVESVGDTPLRDMTVEQLEQVYEMYTMVLTMVRNVNKAFVAKRTEGIAGMGRSAIKELRSVGKDKDKVIKALEGLKGFAWSDLKPVYAFKVIGSNTLSELFHNVRKGEDTWAVDVTQAKEFYRQQADKYGYDDWDMETRHRFYSNTGKSFTLSLEQIMSLYAYSKRRQADEHLERGGFVFDSAVEVVEKKKGIPTKYNVNTAEAFNLNREGLEGICKTLTREQRAFVDAMQDYLSDTMGAKGNEVTMELYGIKLFKEKNYFPLKSAAQYMFAQNQAAGEVRLKNAGFSKNTVPRAGNPVILGNFMDVWTGHVDEMSMYHAMVLPLEDFNRVFNFKTPALTDTDIESVKAQLQNIYGKHPVDYISQLITQLNGGVRSDPTEGFWNRRLADFKKAAVFASLSVAIQQPSAIARATAYLDPQYFIGSKLGKPTQMKLAEEMKKYAPVAVIKEMGYFDTDVGRSTKDYIMAKAYTGVKEKTKGLVTDKEYRDELMGWLPAKMDELTWTYIWQATKREIRDKNPELQVGSDAFLKAAGERFTEIIVHTQVYDSVLSRSAMMRSKTFGMKMVTSFMAEPTTSVNMVADALIQGKRGDRRYCRKAIGGVIASQILNAMLVSVIYAMRDDDEAQTYGEKYLEAFFGKLVESFNPLTYVPFFKDIVSVCSGYTVERSDLSVITDIYQAWQKLDNEDVTLWEKIESFGGSICNMFGLPLKNIMRDVRGLWQTATSIGNSPQGTWAGAWNAIMEGFTGQERSKSKQLYSAVLQGDEKQIQRVRATYANESTANTAIVSAVRKDLDGGKIAEAKAIEIMVTYAGKTKEEAQSRVQYWKFQKEYPDSELSESAAVKWYTVARDKGISLEVYTQFREAKTQGSKKKEVLAVINSLPLTRVQKDVLYRDAGYAESEIDEAPWN